MMCTTRKHPKLKMTNFENVKRSSMLMSTSKEGAKAGTQEKWRARQALDFLAKLGGTHFSGWSWVRGESALFVKHLSQATCRKPLIYNVVPCQSEWLQWTYMALQRGTTSELFPPNWSLEIRGGELVAVYTYWYVWYMCDVCTWYCTTCALPLKDALQCFKLQMHVAYWSVRED